jgi:anti-sigma regulatory factor (Ser/Thr protein kinase)
MMADGAYALPSGARLVFACTFDLHSIAAVRRAILSRAPGVGLREPFLSDFVLAVNEITTNAVRYGGGRGRLRLWHSVVNLVCEVVDDGAGPVPAVQARMTEQHQPPAGAEGGRGLWLARKLCDTVTVTAGAAGTRVVLAFSAHLRRG